MDTSQHVVLTAIIAIHLMLTQVLPVAGVKDIGLIAVDH